MSGWLTSFRNRRVAALLPLGFASGLPYLLVGGTLSAWLANTGVPVERIGLFALVGLPYSLKLLWAPLLDRFRLPWLGRRRGWLLACQLALMALVAALGDVDPRRAPHSMFALALGVSLLSATQDTAVDGYRSDVLLPDERAAGGAVFVLGYRLAMLTSGALALVLADRMPWRAVYAVMALAMTVGVAATIGAPEPALDPAATAPRTIREAVNAPLAEFFRRPGALWLLGFVAAYRLADLLASGLTNPFLLSLGFGNSEIGLVNKAVGIAATIVGALGGAVLVTRLGLWRALVVFGIAQGIANLGWALLAVVGKRHGLLVVVVGVDNLCTGLVVAALETLLLGLCDRRYSVTQYALFTSSAGIVARLVGAGAGFVAARLGWPAYFTLTAVAALPALALVGVARRRSTISPRALT